MSESKGKVAPGWYISTEEHNTVAYWDGQDWSDRSVPRAGTTIPPKFAKTPRGPADYFALGVLFAFVAGLLAAGEADEFWTQLALAIAAIPMTVGLVAGGVRLGMRMTDLDRLERHQAQLRSLPKPQKSDETEG